MDVNLTFKFISNTLVISEVKKIVDYNSLNNTNVIDIKELKFSTTYIKENMELVSSYLKVIILKNNISTVQINNMNIALISLQLINTWDNVKKIIFKPNKKINMDLFLLISENNYLKEIDCYEIAPYLIERLDLNKKIKVHVRNKSKTDSRFMKENFLETYTDIYYKKSIVISGKIDEIDFEGIKSFININNNLKIIKIIDYSNELITTILNELKMYNKENITIIINQENNDLNALYNTINYLKKKYRSFIENNRIVFKIKYSESYKSKNFIKEINFKLLIAIITIIIITSSITLLTNYYIQYNDQQKINKQINYIEKIIDDETQLKTIDDNESDIGYIDVDDITTTKSQTYYESVYYTNFQRVFDRLLEINNETVGWINVPNTKIDYPVVQAVNNSYYLDRDYKKNKNSLGWIFMDYRNNKVDLSKNTILYGHNAKIGIMFGNLKNTLNPSWYTKQNNQIITFNNPYRNMKWKIFSIYRINTTEDYLQTEFSSDEEYIDFTNMLKNRSIYDFKTNISPDSKIITLSTCYTNTTRTVMHAVLIEDTGNPEYSNNIAE